MFYYNNHVFDASPLVKARGSRSMMKTDFEYKFQLHNLFQKASDIDTEYREK